MALQATINLGRISLVLFLFLFFFLFLFVKQLISGVGDASYFLSRLRHPQNKTSLYAGVFSLAARLHRRPAKNLKGANPNIGRAPPSYIVIPPVSPTPTLSTMPRPSSTLT